MSLILEALRKSEAERQRGRAPDLHAAVTPTAPRHEPRTSPWPWLVAVLAVAVAAALWWRGQPSPAITDATPRLSAAEPPAPVASYEPAMANAAPRFVPNTPTPATAPEPALIAPSDAPSRSQLPSSVPAPTPATPAIDTPVIAPDMPPATPGSETNEDADITSLSTLDSAQRAALPPLKVSMHVWNAEPAQRFILIDGQRMCEGGRLDEVVIERIERESVVLAWRGQRLRLPRP